MFIVTRFWIADGKENHSQQRYDEEKQAVKRFWTIYVSDIDNDNIEYELIQMIEMSTGLTLYNQVFDNRKPEE